MLSRPSPVIPYPMTVHFSIYFFFQIQVEPIKESRLRFLRFQCTVSRDCVFSNDSIHSRNAVRLVSDTVGRKNNRRQKLIDNNVQVLELWQFLKNNIDGQNKSKWMKKESRVVQGRGLVYSARWSRGSSALSFDPLFTKTHFCLVFL